MTATTTGRVSFFRNGVLESGDAPIFPDEEN